MRAEVAVMPKVTADVIHLGNTSLDLEGLVVANVNLSDEIYGLGTNIFIIDGTCDDAQATFESFGRMSNHLLAYNVPPDLRRNALYNGVTLVDASPHVLAEHVKRFFHYRIIEERLCEVVLADDDKQPDFEMRDFFPFVVPKKYVLGDAMNNLPNLLPESTQGYKTLVLGAGSGVSQLMFSEFFGFETYGIEGRRQLVDSVTHAFEIFENEDLLNYAAPQIYFGNFFPADFEVGYKERWGDLEKIPVDLQNARPYDEMGLGLEDFNVVYSFQYSANNPAIMRMVGERCKPGTILIVNEHFDELPGNVKEVERSVCFGFYRVE